ncbi:hypothetical protein GQ457_02G027300 [Hibiscus cannabinus]
MQIVSSGRQGSKGDRVKPLFKSLACGGKKERGSRFKLLFKYVFVTMVVCVSNRRVCLIWSMLDSFKFLAC